MRRQWQMLVWTGKKYEKPTSDGICKADGPAMAIKKFGLDDPMYEVKYSRKGYGYFTGRVELRSPETVSARTESELPLPADFVLLAER